MSQRSWNQYREIGIRNQKRKHKKLGGNFGRESVSPKGSDKYQEEKLEEATCHQKRANNSQG